VTLGPVAEYLRELERLLRERGCADARIVDEAREHLADATEEGIRRGLARVDAEHEAVARFGPVTLIAAQALRGRSRMIVEHWRGITAATAAAALMTGVASYYWLPAQYRSESVIAVTSDPSHERLHAISEAVLSNSRLEKIVKDLGVGDGTPMQVRGRIGLEVSRESPEQFTVSFASGDARQAQRVTERLASLFIQENLQQAGAGGVLDGALFRIVRPPSLPREATKPGLAKTTVSGAFAGLALSIAALIWRRGPRAG
jgi:hypothetical protein